MNTLQQVLKLLGLVQIHGQQKWSWSITDCDGNVLASMEAGAGLPDQAVDLPDNYILTLTDSYGDGGGQVTIGDTVYTLDGGSSEIMDNWRVC